MPGERREDMKLIAEYIDYMGLYRLYNPEHPSQTVAYEDDLKDAERHSLENGYDGIVIK